MKSEIVYLIIFNGLCTEYWLFDDIDEAKRIIELYEEDADCSEAEWFKCVEEHRLFKCDSKTKLNQYLRKHDLKISEEYDLFFS